jgi:hypothetical protein
MDVGVVVGSAVPAEARLALLDSGVSELKLPVIPRPATVPTPPKKLSAITNITAVFNWGIK